MNSFKRYFDGIIFFADVSGFVNVIRFWRARLIQKLANEAARCVFYYLMCVINYDGFVRFKCVLEIIMFEYDTGK
jgi:hypothetical protein